MTKSLHPFSFLRHLSAMTLLLLASCAEKPDSFSSYTTLHDSRWAYDDTLVFTPDIAPAVSGDLTLGLRHNGNYPYRNLWIEVTTPLRGDSVVRRDTLSIELADKYGLWKGTGVGPLRQVQVTVANDVRVDSGAPVFVRHIMRVDTLPDVEQVGIFIEPSDKTR